MPTQNNVFGASQENNPLAQLLRQMKGMQDKIDGLTLSNTSRGQDLRQNKVGFADVNPKTGLTRKKYCWSCRC